MEAGLFIPESFLPRAEFPEILSSFRGDIIEQFQYNPADRSFINRYIHVYIRILRYSRAH